MWLYRRVVAIANRSQCFVHFDIMEVLWWLLSMFRGHCGNGFGSLNRRACEPPLSKWPSRTQRMVMQMQTTEDLHQSRSTSLQKNRHSSIVQFIIHRSSHLHTDAMQKLRGRSQLLFYESAHFRERIQVRCQTYRAF